MGLGHQRAELRVGRGDVGDRGQDAVAARPAWPRPCSAATTAATARSMPRHRSTGLGAARRSPRRRPGPCALASTIAVVVPSPATSLVCIETSRTTCAPMFSNRSGSSISAAMLTPSRVIIGVPIGPVDHRVHALGPERRLDGGGQPLRRRAPARARASAPWSMILGMCSSSVARQALAASARAWRQLTVAAAGTRSRMKSTSVGSLADVALPCSGRWQAPAQRAVELHVDPDPAQLRRGRSAALAAVSGSPSRVRNARSSGRAARPRAEQELAVARLLPRRLRLGEGERVERRPGPSPTISASASALLRAGRAAPPPAAA